MGRGSGGREGDGGRGTGAECGVERSPLITEAYVGLILFNETAALFMMNKIRGTSQLNIDILMYSSRRESDV